MNDFTYTFLLIGYQFKRNFDCAPSSGLALYPTLSEAIELCNIHADCNCIEFDRTIGFYGCQIYTYYYDERTQVYEPEYDSWVISFLSNRTIDSITLF